MAITKFTDNLDFVASLPDKPAMPAQELKETFDKGPKAIKDYINNILTTEIDRISGDIRDNVKAQLLADNKKKYHIGKIVMSASDVNPSEYLGFGVWKKWGEGRVPVGVDTAQTEFDTPEKIGGNKNNVAQISFGATWMYYKQKPTNFRANKRKLLQSGIEDIDVERNDGIQIGDGIANNLQPYITCYMYKRIS